MRAHPQWSYRPYRPPFIEVGEIYICRVVPAAESVTLDWLVEEPSEYEVYISLRNQNDFRLAGKTKENSYCITGLKQGKEYEFYVRSGEKKSRIRLARCDDAFGVVVNYLHPEDDAYSFSGKYLCSPSIVRHPDGHLLCSMDLFAGGFPQNLSLIYRSDDNGATWKYQCELFPCFWGKLFIHEKMVYMLACSTEYGDLLIGKSEDGGKTFGPPSVLLRGGNGKNGEAGVHKNPEPVLCYQGRIWNTLEWGAWGRGYHAPMVMSAKMDADLEDPESWSFSEPVPYNPNWDGVPKGESTGNIEGCLVPLNGRLYNIMRYDMSRLERKYGLVIAYLVDTENYEKPLEYSHCIEFPANHSKFEIQYVESKKKFYSIVSRIVDEEHAGARNILSVMESEDCMHWRLLRDIQNRHEEDPKKVGFQYVDFIVEGNKLLFLCRTALNQAHNFHDSNYTVFDTLEL